MPKFTVLAKQINYCELEIEADSLEAAELELKDWIEDDLLEYRLDSEWEIDISKASDD